MSPSIVSFPTMLFTSFIFVIISTSISPVQCRNLNIAPTPSSPNYPMLEIICNDVDAFIDEHAVCIDVLQSIPKISHAEGLQNLAIAIIESGISNSTNTRAYIEAAFYPTVTTVGVKEALNECMAAYDQVVQGFSVALGSVRARDQYTAASYELLTSSTDYVKLCDKALAKQNVEYEVISRGNNAVPIFGLSAFSTVNQLHDQSRFPPPPNVV